jgi:murein DD-endopeptidase MepM/ murein hydrolase activator NlpD
VRPVPGFKATTRFGKRGPHWSCRRDRHGNGIHTGVDFAAPAGTPVVAARRGRVVYANHGAAFGSHQIEVVVDGSGRDFYAHMSTRLVGNGSIVRAGQQIGVVGSEGNATGPHLHFERHRVQSGPWSCDILERPWRSVLSMPAWRLRARKKRARS